jgi:hypothetical protein
MLGHSSTAITELGYTSVFEDEELEAAESAAALVPRAHRDAGGADVPTACAHLWAVWADEVPPGRTKRQVRKGVGLSSFG